MGVSCSALPLFDPLIPSMDQLFALDCLSTGLRMDPLTGLPVDTSLLQVKAGGLSCGGSPTVTPQGMALAMSLVVLHAGLFLGPLFATIWIKGLTKKYPQQTAVQAPAWVQASMVVFSVGTLGEIGAHMHDKWCASVTTLPARLQAMTFACGLGKGGPDCPYAWASASTCFVLACCALASSPFTVCPGASSWCWDAATEVWFSADHQF